MPELSLIIPARFCGPPSSGNGGWTAGALATLLGGCPDDRAEAWPVVEVSLRQPPPLDTPLTVAAADRGLSALHAGEPVVLASPVDEELVEVEPVRAGDAVAASPSYPGFDSHPFPSCFVCGPDREEGDGLRIFPGQVDPSSEGRNRVAAPWVPHRSQVEDFHTYTDDHPRASLAVTWAALDCPSAWAADMEDRAMVLARMRARVDTLPVVGEPHVVVGEARSREGRKNHAATTLYDSDGRVVATAEHLWIEVDPAAFG